MPLMGEAGKKALNANTAAQLLQAMGATLSGVTFTQTYSTATSTHAAPTAAALTGTLTGTANGSLADVAAIALSTSDTYSDAAVNTAVNTAITAVNEQLKELQTQVNALVADDANTKQVLNRVIDVLQSAGIAL